MHPATGIRAYATVGVETGVAAADPHGLVLMLFEGALLSLANARRHLLAGEVESRCAAIGKAIMIIDGGLQASLDVKAGGELARNLSGLYDYMSRRLLLANLRSDPSLIEEVSQLLSELYGAWRSIPVQSRQVSAGAGSSAAPAPL